MTGQNDTYQLLCHCSSKLCSFHIWDVAIEETVWVLRETSVSLITNTNKIQELLSLFLVSCLFQPRKDRAKNVEVILHSFKCQIEKVLNAQGFCALIPTWSPQPSTQPSVCPVFIRDPNKAISHCAAKVAVITESIRDVQTPQIPFSWETYWKGQKTNRQFGTSDS